MAFVHLHVHTNFSFGDGAARIDELVESAASAGMPALAVTDHEGLYGAVRFYQAAQKAGIKPIVGVEITVAATDDARSGYHLVLLARDYAGWSNLCRIVSAAHLEHQGEPPLARLETVAAHASHLIALSACRRGEIGSRILAGDRAGARHAASVFSAIFARGDFFVELHNELLPDSAHYLRELDLLAHELRLPTVATNNVHYVTRADAPLHDVLAAEAANQPLPNPLGRKNGELHLKTPGQMWRLFRRYPEAYRNAMRIANRCNLDLRLGRLHFPSYPLPPGETAYSLLCKHCFKGAEERYRPVTPEVLDRLQRELKVIEQLGFAEYFLAVRDIVEFTRSRGISYSGRGSAGNSIVSYVLRITDADPIAHDLLFERFLNPERREMPDVDIDFCSARRDEVIEFIYQRFGADNVAMVATVNTVHAPSAVRIVAKAFDYRPEEVNRLSRKVPWGSAAKLGEMLVERPELANHEFQHPHYRRLVHLAERLANYPAHLGTHLGGFILARDPLTDRVPLQWAAKGVVVAQFDKDDIETLGLVKMDILGLKMHSAIAEAVRRIEQRTGVEISPWELPRDDPAVYDLISSARTVGVFQLESSGQRNLATRLRERTFEDVIAAISLFRPGPLQAEMIGPYIRRRHGHEKVTVAHPDMWPILKSTYGVILYQEQVIAVAAAIAGFSLAEGDMLRRAMTHERSMEEMDEIGRGFVSKAAARGIDRVAAEDVFRQLRGFAAYGFNKAHAACFAVLCNASAWLKAHYPAEFFCGILNNQPMGFYSPRVVLNDARRWGLTVLPLDIDLSLEDFSVADDGRAIRVGFNYVKEMSAAAMRTIIAARGEGDGRGVAERGEGEGDGNGVAGGRPRQASASLRPGCVGLPEPPATPLPSPSLRMSPGAPRPYTSLSDFCARTRVSIEIVENLVRVGAFDSLGVRREELLAQLPLVHARVMGGRGVRARGAADGTGASAPTPETLTLPLDEELPPLPFLPAWTTEQRVAAELEILGLNVSAHPLSFFHDEIERLKAVPFARLRLVPDGRRVLLAGVLERAQMPWIRSGHRTLFLTLEDETDLAEVVVFNDVYLKYGRLLKDATYLLVEGELQNNDERGLAIVAQRIFDLTQVVRGSTPAPRVEPRTRPGRTG